MFLQSYVVAVCLFEEREGQAHLHSLQGTAFFVGKSGLFLTARHVLENALHRSADSEQKVGLVVKGNNGTSANEEIVPIADFEFAPRPYDIAAGLVPYHPDSPLRFAPLNVSLWQEVATLGYPESAAVNEGQTLWMNLRAHRGYVQRCTLSRDVPLGEHPSGLELSFLLGPGMSGAPVFAVPDEIVIGVAVGSHRSEEVEDSIVEVSEDGREFREKRVRIEQHGFAHCLTDLLHWRPNLFAGRSLVEASEA